MDTKDNTRNNIYRICDLLDAKKSNLAVKEDKTRGIYV